MGVRQGECGSRQTEGAGEVLRGDQALCCVERRYSESGRVSQSRSFSLLQVFF